MSESTSETIPSKSSWSLASRGRQLGRIFLFILVGCLAFGAILAILSLVTMRLSEFQGRILMTTFSLGVYSLIGLCCSFLIDGKRFVVVGCLGVLVTMCGGMFAVATTWDLSSNMASVIQGRLAFLVTAISFGHASLLLLLESRHLVVVAIRWVTIGMIAVVGGLLVLLCFNPSMIESLWLFLALAGIVDVFGTLATPLLHLATRKTG